jgi:WD40 repeat protein
VALAASLAIGARPAAGEDPGIARFDVPLAETACYSPDGRTLATGGFHDGTVILWDVAGCRESGRHGGLLHTVQFLAFSPDGALVLMADGHGTLIGWDRVAGRERYRLRGEFGGPGTIRLSADGRLLAAAVGRAVQVFDAADGRLLDTLHGPTGAVLSLAFAPDGRTLAAGGPEGVGLWDAARGRPVGPAPGGPADATVLAFSPDGRRLAIAGEDGAVRLWGVDDGTWRGTLRGHARRPDWGLFAPDGRTLATSERDGSVRLWGVDDGHLVASIPGEQGVSPASSFLKGVLGMAFAPDGRTLATGGGDGLVRFWDTTDGHLRGARDGVGGLVAAVAFAPDGRTVAAAVAGAQPADRDRGARGAVGREPGRRRVIED